MNTSFVQKFFRDSSWTLGAKSLSAGLSFFQILIVAKLLPQYDFGQYLLILSLVWGLSTFIQWGLGTSIVSEFSKQTFIESADARINYLCSCFLIIICNFFLVAVSLWIFANLTSFEIFKNLTSTDLVIMEVLVLVHAITFFLPEVFRGRHRIRITSMLTGPFPNLISIGLILIFRSLQIPLTVSRALLFHLIALGFSALLGLACLVYYEKLRFQRISNWKNIFFGNFGLIIFQIVIFLSGQLDLWVLSLFSKHDEVAIYGFSQKCLFFYSFLPVVLGTSLLSQIAYHYHEKNHDVLIDLFRRSMLFSTGLCLVLLIIQYFIGPTVLGNLVRSEYRLSQTPLLILAIGQTIQVSFGPVGYFFLMTGRRKILILTTGICCVLGVSLGMAMAYSGVNASLSMAIGSGTSLACQGLLMYIFVRREIAIQSFWSSFVLWKKT